ncbi:MAG: hypothetical protein GY732_05060, partial [Gammaproteobacteria bacterium]|nr:hypothetical protein [Gammaproteobacteria bacterium]
MRSTTWYNRPWLQLIVAGLLLITGLLAATPYGIGYAIDGWLKENGAGTVALGDVDFNPFTGELAVYNLTVTGDKEEVLSLVECEATVVWWSLLQRRLHIEKLTLSGPKLLTERTASGELLVAGLVIADGEGEDATGKPWQVGLGRLRIQDGVVHY